jgi:hypothetical protein
MMHGGGKSDEAVVAGKPANEGEQSVEEPVERRAPGRINFHSQGRGLACRLQRGDMIGPGRTVGRQRFGTAQPIGPPKDLPSTSDSQNVGSYCTQSTS